VLAHLRLASSFALTASLLAFVSASCGLDTSGTDTALDDDGAAPLDASGSLDTSLPSDAHGAADAVHLGDTSAPDGAHATDASPPLDATADAIADATPPADASLDASPPPDSSPVCNSSNGCITVPSGWSLVAVETSQSDACPSGFSANPANNVVEGPTVGANACGCTPCTLTTPPSCTGVPVDVFYDGDLCPAFPACGCAGVPASNQNAHADECNTDLYTGNLAGLDIKFVPGAPAAGTCSAASVENTQNVTYAAHDRVCVQDTPSSGNCTGDQCTPTLPTPYQACIAQAGHQTCPAPFTASHDTGSGADYTCGACGCATSTTAKCEGTMTYYTDTMCMNGAKTFDADGTTCASAGAGAYGSYIFAGMLGAGTTSCSATAGAPSVVTLANELTVCCQP
jgi:hypothetical protein